MIEPKTVGRFPFLTSKMEMSLTVCFCGSKDRSAILASVRHYYVGNGRTTRIDGYAVYLLSELRFLNQYKLSDTSRREYAHGERQRNSKGRAHNDIIINTGREVNAAAEEIKNVQSHCATFPDSSRKTGCTDTAGTASSARGSVDLWRTARTEYL
jgi:hypothetical protein